MNVFWVGGVSPTVTIAPEQENAFREATTIFVGVVLTVIGDKLVDAYLHMRVAKNLWDALEAKFGATDAGSELYAMEQFHDYRMVDNRHVLDQAHEIQCISKELELLKLVKSEVPDQKVGTIIESKDATFFEDMFPMRNMQSTSRLEFDETPEPAIPMEYYEHKSDESSSEDDEEAPVRSKRQKTAKSFGDDFLMYLVDDDTPSSISEAYASPDADYWKDRKLRPDGTVEKYKARLVAKGYTQKEEEDFFDTYSLVARRTTIRVLLALAASHGLLVHQMDVKTAFLNGELDEKIYMQ
nr:uncharacterized protein LOC120972760 [Aegilops tauschii subsp. strangulata]